MDDFTLLTQFEIFGPNQFHMIGQYGKKCAITDYAILLGGYVSDSDYVEKDYVRKNRTTWYWAQNRDFNNRVMSVSESGESCSRLPYKRTGGIRPVMNIKTDGDFKFINKDEFEYGEYPQTIVEKYEARNLERMFLKGTLNPTGKTYEADSISYRDEDTNYTPREFTEYQYNGKKYIRIMPTSDVYGEYLSDNTKVEKNEPCWILVEPIRWYIDYGTNKAVSKYALVSGIQYKNDTKYDGNFANTEIHNYLNNVFAKDIKKSNTFVPIGIDENNEKEKEGTKKMEKLKNPYNFDFNSVTEEDIIKGALLSNVAVFLHGRSSEGKSARVKQFDPDCEIVYLRNATPDSLNGKSVYNAETGEMIDIPPTWYKKLKKKCEDEPDKLHLLFFDEISNALPSIQGMAFNIVLDGEVNGIWKLPENARIVAAGNDLNDSLAANSIAEPLFNRFAHVYINTTVDSWLMWASTPKQSYQRLDYQKGEEFQKIHPAVYAYIAYKAYRGQDVLRTPYNGVKPNADPRKWEMASKVLFQTRTPEMLRSLVGEEITADFTSFCRQQVITVQDVINGNYTNRDLEMNLSEKFATAVGLSSVDEKNLRRVREFVKLLGPEICATFDTLWIHGDEKRLEIIAEIKLEEQLMGENVCTKRK